MVAQAIILALGTAVAETSTDGDVVAIWPDAVLSALISSAAPAVLALLLAWAIGNSLSLRHETHKKVRELDVAALQEFYDLYGGFYSLWKRWNFAQRRPGAGNGGELLDEAASLVGKLESLLIRICAQRSLTRQEVQTLGSFRQAYSSLRDAMKDGHPLQWSSSDHPDYVRFKSFAVSTVSVLQPRSLRIFGTGLQFPTRAAALANLLEVTSNSYEHSPSSRLGGRGPDESDRRRS